MSAFEVAVYAWLGWLVGMALRVWLDNLQERKRNAAEWEVLSVYTRGVGLVAYQMMMRASEHRPPDQVPLPTFAAEVKAIRKAGAKGGDE